jgi:spermidine/putrescine-binding protein
VTRALAAGIAVIALVAAGCGGDNKSAATTTSSVSVTTHGRFHYPDAVITNYMRSCTKNGAVKAAYCACTLDKLSNTVSTADFARIGLSGGKIPPHINRLIRRAAVACADKL